jgi:hypothetical protein
MTYKGRAPFQSAAFTETQRNFTYFDKSLSTALTDVVIESPGDFLYIDQASTGVVRVELNMRQGGSLAPITLAAGGSIECDFSSVKITADAQLNKSVRIVIGNGARIKGGANVNASSMSVSVVDGGKLRTQGNQAFMGSGYMAATAAAYSHVQIWNPSTSGKNVYVEKLLCGLGVAGSISIARHNAAISTLTGSLLSKYSGGADSACQIRTEANAAALYSGTFAALYLPATTAYNLELAEPILLTPGKGLIFINQTVNRDLAVCPEVFEE